LVSERLTLRATDDEAKTIARGRELVERYNCIACHQIETNSPQIRQYFKFEDIITRAPPPLRGEGNKIQHDWLFKFLKHIEPLRPLLGEQAGGIRMPSFPATDDEWAAIIAYFSAVSNKESLELGRQIDPVIKYVDAQRKATTQPVAATAAEARPGDDWWQRREFAAAAEALKSWGLTFGHIKPIEVGPLASQDELRKVYATLLFKAHFTRQLYNAPYPFVDSPRPQISDERFDLGKKFMYEMQCLKCHVLGDPNVAGATKAPTAPNLGLTSQRLQHRWVKGWVQEPNIIQVGTAMPPFFSGLFDKDGNLVLKPEGQSWPHAQATVRPAAEIEAEYGATVEEQTALLLDFIYAAGVRGFTGVQPESEGAPAAEPSAQPAQAPPPAVPAEGAATTQPSARATGFSTEVVHAGQ
jgi:mono/diheme cytochrome c family protein